MSLLGLASIEPVRANVGNAPCSTQSAETLSPTVIGPVKADAVEAYTRSAIKSAAALSGVSKPEVRLGPLVITAQAVQGSAAATCNGATPVLSSASRVIGLQVNGQGVTITPEDKPFSMALPGGGVLAVNETITSNGEVTRRAVDVNLPGVGQVVLAEARAGIDSASCAAHGTPAPTPNVCPSGALFDPGSGFCVIPGKIDTVTHTVTRTIVVGRPYEGPSGGSVIPLGTARKRYKSPCLSGGAPKFVIIGTRHADRITGTNRSDRILTFGGNDVVDGGRGNDCIDGGSGNDVLAGGIGNDQVHGSTGKDHVNGNSGRDRLWGGAGRDIIVGGTGNDRIQANAGRDLIQGDSGNDVIHAGSGNDRVLGGPGNDRLYGQSGNDAMFAGYGRDRLYGGPGNDLLDTSIFGPAAQLLNGGPGRDTARYNPEERHALRRIEHRQLATVKRLK